MIAPLSPEGSTPFFMLMPPDMRDRLREVAAEQQRTMAEIVRTALSEYFRNERVEYSTTEQVTQA